MKMKMDFGNIAYLIGFFGAIILGLLAGLGVFAGGVLFTTILVVAGIVIGMMNITKAEQVPMMISSLVIGVGSAVLIALPFVGALIAEVLQALATVFIPAGIVTAVMVVMTMGK